MVVVQKQSSMAFKMKSSIAKLTDATSEHNKKLKAEYDNKMQAYQDSTASYQNELRINELMRDPKGYDMSKDRPEKPGDIFNPNKVIDEYMNLTRENFDRRIYDDKNRRTINTEYDDTAEADTSVGSKFVGKRRKEGDPLYSEDPLGEYQLPSRKMIENKMKPTKPEKPNYRENQKIVMMKSKNLEFIPTGEQEFKPKKALPQELSKSDYFTVTSKYHHSGDKYILKDSAGREVDRVTEKEYKEKYGDILQRGTKKYGKENLQRRLYIKK